MFVKPLLCILLAGVAPMVWAQKMAPGLWENSVSIKSGDGQIDAALAKMQESMAKMPPEQRKMMEDMMAKQGVGVGSKPNSVKVCISKEQAERGDLPQQAEGRCKQDSLQRSGSTLKYKFSCTDPAATGEGEFSFSGDKAYTGTLVMNATRDGKPQRMEMRQAGKWLGADCGTLKPR